MISRTVHELTSTRGYQQLILFGRLIRLQPEIQPCPPDMESSAVLL